MKRIQQLMLLLSVLLVTLTGCRESLTEEAVAPRGVAVEIAVRPDGMQEQTRSTDEDAIDDLNFYLYDDQGSLLLHRYQQATTLRFEVVPGHYRMRLAANLGRDLGENPSEEELRISGSESYERLPMAAEEEFDVTAAGASPSTVEVRRCVAKVSYEIDVQDPHIELRSVQLISRPRTAALFDPEAAPSSDPVDYMDGPETTLTGTAASGACYLLPNLQGTVPSITDQRQKSPEHAPEHASYLLIRAANGSRNLLYTVYLGGNNTSDFNVRANVHYTFRISILGDNEIDTRVYSYSIQVWDDFDDYRFGDYCIYEGTTLLHIDVENNDEELLLNGTFAVISGESSKVFFDDFHGESGSEFRVYSPNGDNLFGVQYSPTVYTSSNSRFAYRITLRDPYGVCGTYDFEHRMANVVYVKPSAGGTISVSGALWSGETGSGSSLRSVALCYEQGCSLTARAGAGYQFEGWYSDSGYTQRLSTSATYVFRPQKARTELYARFKAEAIPLDEDGTANCYIAPKLRTFYSFDATVQGNGKTTTNIRPQRLNGTSAILIWETGTERNAIISDVSFADGRITFTTGSKRGNAVIGLLDSRGDCIWSWHIWSVDYDIESSGQTYFSGKTFMDRNLGALTTDCTQPSSRGMYYQWGRKDPFIYPANNQDTRKFADAVYASGYEYGESYPDTSSDPESMMSISWATAHPTTYMNGAFYSDWDDRTTIIDWLYDSSPNLWGNPTTSSNTVTATSTKSIYDPCPPGWKTPSPQDLKGIQYVGRFQPNYVTIQYNSGRTTQIPMGGTLSEGYFMSNGQIGRLYTNVPYYYRWESGTSVYSERACTSLFFSSSMGTTDYYRYAANPVRCVRE
mgnify:FL=1